MSALWGARAGPAWVPGGISMSEIEYTPSACTAQIVSSWQRTKCDPSWCPHADDHISCEHFYNTFAYSIYRGLPIEIPEGSIPDSIKPELRKMSRETQKTIIEQAIGEIVSHVLPRSATAALFNAGRVQWRITP